MKSLMLYVALVVTLMGSASAEVPEVQGQGAVGGHGWVRGRGVMRGEGSVTGTGMVLYRDEQGRVRRRCGTGSVEGQGIALGRGRGCGQGRGFGRGRAFGRGRVRPCGTSNSQ